MPISPKFFLLLLLSLLAGASTVEANVFPHKHSRCVAKENIWYWLYIPNSSYCGDVWQINASPKAPSNTESVLIVKKGQVIRNFGVMNDGVTVYAVGIPLEHKGCDAHLGNMEAILDPANFTCGPDSDFE